MVDNAGDADALPLGIVSDDGEANWKFGDGVATHSLSTRAGGVGDTLARFALAPFSSLSSWLSCRSSASSCFGSPASFFSSGYPRHKCPFLVHVEHSGRSPAHLVLRLRHVRHLLELVSE